MTDTNKKKTGIWTVVINCIVTVLNIILKFIGGN